MVRGKLQRIWRAFTSGFWEAWRAVPPPKVGELSVKLSCDTSEFTGAIDMAISRLYEVKSAAEAAAEKLPKEWKQ